MNRKLELLALLFLADNHYYGNKVINLIRRKVLITDESFKSISNYLRERAKIESQETMNEKLQKLAELFLLGYNEFSFMYLTERAYETAWAIRQKEYRNARTENNKLSRSDK